MISVVRPAHRLAQCEPDARLGRRVDRRGGVVEDQDARVGDERTGDRDALALPARQRQAALADHGVVAVRERADEVVRLRAAGRLLDLGVARIGSRERDVVAHRGREQERVLRDRRDRAPQRTWLELAHVDAVDDHPPGLHVVQPRDQRGQRRLARAGRADQRERATRRQVEIDAVEHRPRRVVAEAHALEPQLARARPAVAPAAPAAHDLRLLVEQLEHAAAGRDGALHLADPHAEHAERHHQHREVEVEREEAADRERARRRRRARPRTARSRRPAAARDRAAAGRSPAAGSRRPAGGTPPRSGRGSGRPRAISCANALTTRTPTIASSACVVTSATRCCTSRSTGYERREYRDGRPDHDRREHERREREHGARPDQQHDDGEHQHDVLRHEDQAVAEERADRRHVGRRTAQELTRLVVVVVLLLERQEVAVDAGTQVVLDIEREPPREQRDAPPSRPPWRCRRAR